MEERIRKFAVLIAEGSFTKAAKRLHVSQPALSTAMQKLERELKCEILVRGSHPIKASPAGQEVLRAANAQQDNLSNLRARLKELANQKPRLAMGLIDGIADILDSGDELDRLFVEAQVTLSIDNSSRLTDAVAQGLLDMALVVRQSHADGRLEDTFVGNEPMVLVCRPYVAAKTIESLGLGTVPDFFSYNPSSTTERLIREQLHTRGLVPEARFYSSSPTVMLELLQKHDGTAVLPYALVSPYIASGRIAVPMPAFIADRPIHMVTRSGRVLPGPARSFADSVSKRLVSLSAVCRLQFKV